MNENFNQLENLKEQICEKSNELLSIMKEVGIDEYAESLKEILSKISDNVAPIKTIKSIYELTLSLKFKKDLKNLSAFLDSLKSGNITHKDIEKYAKKYSKSDEALKDDIEKILLILSSYRDEEKSKILGNLYVNLIKEKINYREFQTLSEILNNLLIVDIETIVYLYKNRPNYDYPNQYFNSLYRLQALGLIRQLNFQSTGTINNEVVEILSDGNMLCKYGLLKLNI